MNMTLLALIAHDKLGRHGMVPTLGLVELRLRDPVGASEVGEPRRTHADVPRPLGRVRTASRDGAAGAAGA